MLYTDGREYPSDVGSSTLYRLHDPKITYTLARCS